MRKIYSFMVAAVAIFAAASCNKELPQREVLPVGETVVYSASVDGADTKAVLNEETKKSEWVAGDAITVHDGTKGWKFVADKAGQHTDFSNSEGFGDYRPVMAVYPSGDYTANVAAKTARAYIPTYQQAQAGTYHNVAALAVAYSEGNTFAFKNAHALLKFTVNTDNVTHVIFHGNGSEAITGDVNVTLGEDGVESVECLETEFTEQKWNEETQKNEDVKVKKYGTWVECYAYHDDANKYFTKGQTYYIAVAPQEFKGGVTVKVKIDGGEELVAKSTTKPVETKINTILNLGEIKYDAPVVHEWAVAGTFNEWDSSANPMVMEGDYYVARNITGLVFTAQEDPKDLSSSTGIKFVNKGTNWRGGEGKVTAGTWAYVWGDGGNIYVDGASADTQYDIYLNPKEGDYGKFVIVAAGAEMPEDKPAEEPEVETATYYMRPSSGWTQENGRYAAWCWGTDNLGQWCDFADSDSDGIFEVEIPVNCESAIFLCMKVGTKNEWANELARTGDLLLPIDNKNCYNGYTNTWGTVAEVKAYDPAAIYAEDGWVYLKPNSYWTQANARFAIYFFGKGEKWVSMTKVEGTSYYGVNISAIVSAGYTGMIFCRMNPSASANNWNNKWNQSGDLNVKDFKDGKNCFTVKSGTWDGATSQWSTVTKLN